MMKKSQNGMLRTALRNNRIWRSAATALLALSLNVIAINGQAHNPHDEVQGLGISPDFANDRTLFLATLDELNWRYINILRSTDGGMTWINLPQGMDNIFDVSAIRISPHFSNDHTLFVASAGGGVYQSLDRGNSWQLYNTGLPNLKIKKLKIANAGNSDYVLFSIAGGGNLYRRSGTQAEWSILFTQAAGLTVIAVSPDFSQDATVITANASGNLLISSDSGFNWSDKGNPAGGIIYDMAIAPGNAREIFLATSNGIFYSDDSGQTFINKPVAQFNEAFNNVAVSPNYLIDRTVFCTSVTKAVYKSTDGGNSWVFHDSGAMFTGQTTELKEFSELQISSTFPIDQTVFLSAHDGFFISTDGGNSWVQKQTREDLITGLALSPNFNDDQRMIATTYFGGGIYSSSDRGVTWSLSRDGWPAPNLPMSADNVDFVQNHAGTPLAVVSQNQTNMGFSDNFGENWNVFAIPEFPDIRPGLVYTHVFALSPNFDADQEIYLGTRSHGILQTLDGGANWRANQDVPKSSHITSMVASPNYANDKTAFAVNSAGQVWRTTNGGENWSRIDAGQIVSRGWPNQKYFWIAISPQFAVDRLILVGTNNGVYRSTNGGSSWRPILHSKIGPGTVIRQIEFSPNFSNDRTIYVNVHGKGFYRVSLSNNGGISSLRNAGTSWLFRRNIQFSEFRISPDFAQDATLVGTSRRDVYISTNGGENWAIAGRPGQ